MNTGFITASELKRDVSNVINMVSYEKLTLVVKRHGKPVVKIMPVSKEDSTDSNITDSLSKYFGILPDFPSVTKLRHFKKKKIAL